MAFSTKHCFLLFLLTLLSTEQIHARESQFFNKIPSNNNVVKEAEVVVPNSTEEPLNKPEQEPNFIPENENGGYGLYGHEAGQLPPETTTTTREPYKAATTNLPYNTESKEFLPKYLPKNYNTEAYVTQPEGYTPTEETSYNNNYYNGENQNNYLNNQQQGYTTSTNGENYYNNNYGGNRYNGQQQGMSDTRFAQQGYTTTSANSNNYYSGGNTNVAQNQGMSDTRFAQQGYSTTSANSNNYYNGGNTNAVQKQGMSDTRFLENGKYYHDISLEKNSRINPYENTRGFESRNEYNNYRGYNYGNNENTYEFNTMEGYQNQEQFQDFQDEHDMP